jgi:hypothetical protein
MNFSGWKTFYTRILYAEKFDIHTKIFGRTSEMQLLVWETLYPGNRYRFAAQFCPHTF